MNCEKCGSAMLPDEVVNLDGHELCFMCAGEELDAMEAAAEEARHEDPRDPDRAYDARVDRQMEGKEQANDFDKFMDRIVVDEHQRQRVDSKVEDNPQRRRAARVQDRPMNKTRWGGR